MNMKFDILCEQIISNMDVRERQWSIPDCLIHYPEIAQTIIKFLVQGSNKNTNINIIRTKNPKSIEWKQMIETVLTGLKRTNLVEKYPDFFNNKINIYDIQNFHFREHPSSIKDPNFELIDKKSQMVLKNSRMRENL